MQGSVVNPARKAHAVRRKVTVDGAGNAGANRALRTAGKQLAGVVPAQERAALAKRASAVRELIDVPKRKIA